MKKDPETDISAPEHQESSRRPKFPFLAMGSLLGFLFLYILSIGPFAYFATNGYISSVFAERSLETVYLPLQSLYDSSALFASIMDYYVDWWL